MTTLSEDKDSWKARGIIRRDERHDKSKPEIERARHKPKNKRWCKGKVGVEHSWIVERIEIGTPYRWAYSRWVCSKCEKKSYHTPRGQKADTRPSRTVQR